MLGTIQFRGCSLAWKLEGSGEPVVFIQGVGLHGDGWLPQTQSLKDHYSCLTFDNRGTGKSQPPAVPITIDQMAEDTLTVMDAAGICDAHLVGHSLGGSVALQVALAARGKIRSLSLLCTSARGADATTPTPRMIWLGLKSHVGTRRMRAHAFLEIVVPRDYLATQNRDDLAQRLHPIFGHHLADTPSIVMPQLRALGRFNATARLSELAGVPTLVVTAAHDIIFPPASGRALAAGIPGARYIEIPNAAHGVTIQRADTVNEILREHFARGSY